MPSKLSAQSQVNVVLLHVPLMHGGLQTVKQEWKKSIYDQGSLRTSSINTWWITNSHVVKQVRRRVSTYTKGYTYWVYCSQSLQSCLHSHK